jgi:hypothetical protein
LFFGAVAPKNIPSNPKDFWIAVGFPQEFLKLGY